MSLVATWLCALSIGVADPAVSEPGNAEAGIAEVGVAEAGVAEALTVALGPVRGGPEALTDAALEALRALPGLTVIDVRGLAQTYGPQVVERFRACADDDCRVEAASLVPWDRVAIFELAEGRVIRARLFDRGARSPRVRVSRQIDDEGGEVAVREAVLELFPVRGAGSAAEVTVAGLPEGAQVRFDQSAPVNAASAEEVSARLKPGAHAVEARAPGHAPWRRDFEVRVGAPMTLQASLSKRRSVGPWVLGGSGLALLAGGVALAAVAQIRVDDWSAACAGGVACAPGFTRQRYLGDADALDVEQGASAALLAAGGAALVGAILWFALDPGEDTADGSFSSEGAAMGFRF